jgi:hypothetical protein
MNVLGITLIITALNQSSDRFDSYSRPALLKLVSGNGVVVRKSIGISDLIDNDRVLPRQSASVLIVKTNGNRFAKLQVVAGRQKVSDDVQLPVLILEKFVTFKDGEERTIAASGNSLAVYSGFRFNLDLGQIVPADLPADLLVKSDSGRLIIESIGKADLWLVTTPLPDPLPARPGRPVASDKFVLDHWNGVYQLHDDGRRSGSLEIVVDAQGELTGFYFSAKDGAKYEVKGKVGPAPHAVQFGVRFPRSEQIYQGFLFTGDLSAIAGVSRFGDRETGFYAIRKD